MGVTPEDLVRGGIWKEKTNAEWDEQLKSVEYVLGCYEKNDSWATKIHKNVGVLLTGSMYGLPYMKASVETHKALGYWLVASYDNFIDPDNGETTIDYNRFLPPKDVMNNIDTFLDRKSTRLNSSHIQKSRMPSSA